MNGQEIWKPVKGYEGEYEVSTFGRVRSVDRLSDHYKYGIQFHKGRILKPSSAGRYMLVRLSHCGVVKTKLVHRIVAETFIEKPSCCDVVNHIDENTFNNNVGNLEWCTQKENINHGTGIKRRSLSQSKPIVAMLPDGKEEYYSGTNEAARILMCSAGNICSALKGTRNFAKGRKWRYAEEM